MVFVRLIEDAFTRAETRMYKDVATTMSISSRRYEGRKAADNEEDIRRRGTEAYPSSASGEKQFHGIGDGKVVVSEEEAALPDDKGSTTMCPLICHHWPDSGYYRKIRWEQAEQSEAPWSYFSFITSYVAIVDDEYDRAKEITDDQEKRDIMAEYVA